MKNSTTIIGSGIAILFLIGAIYMFVGNDEGVFVIEESSSAEPIEYFSRGNVFELPGYDGEIVRSKDFKRQILVITVWATWCSYCSTQLDILQEVQNTYRDEVQVIAINRAEPLSIAMDYTNTRNNGSVVYLLDPDDLFYTSIGGYAMPESIIVDKRGEVVSHFREPVTLEALEEAINSLIQ